MSYGSFNATVTDSSGNSIAATITVTNTDGDLVSLYSDAGTTGIANPYSVTDGAISFYCEPQSISISATDGSTTRIWNDVVIIDSSVPKFGKTVTVNFDTDADITLTSAQNQYGRIVITDTGSALTTERQIIVSADERFLTVKNDTDYDIKIVTASGTGVHVTYGEQFSLRSDGTNILTSGNGNVFQILRAGVYTSGTGTYLHGLSQSDFYLLSCTLGRSTLYPWSTGVSGEEDHLTFELYPTSWELVLLELSDSAGLYYSSTTSFTISRTGDRFVSSAKAYLKDGVSY